MAAINIKPKIVTMTQVASGTSNGNQDFPVVPSGKRQVFDYVEVEFSVSQTGNKVTLRYTESGGSAANIWEQIDPAYRVVIPLTTKYPRAPEMEDGDKLNILYERGASACTIDARYYCVEKDI